LANTKRKEVKKMKKKLSICLIILLSLVLVYGFADAKVTGRCDNCHTMHNSQNGAPQAKDDSGALTTTAQGHLAKASCLGCHGIGGVVVGGAPNIFAAVSTDMTAGGSFSTAIAGAKSKRHDITDVFAGGDDSYASGTVANGTPGAAAGTLGKDMDALTLTCAGATGCHGKHTAGYDSDAGIRGFHHGTFTGYRYLQTKAGTAITGTGSAMWEKTASGPGSASQHNVYSSDSSAGISKYCAECHGMFHGTINTQSGTTWVRHPTDTLLTGLTGGTTNIDITSDTAFQNTPVGFDPITTQTTTAITGYDKATAKVICVSCHRAHGSAQDDILRFAYADQTAGQGSVTLGCKNCHVAQR
jgi:predicted CXXCH cytochrome family protein